MNPVTPELYFKLFGKEMPLSQQKHLNTPIEKLYPEGYSVKYFNERWGIPEYLKGNELVEAIFEAFSYPSCPISLPELGNNEFAVIQFFEHLVLFYRDKIEGVHPCG